MGASPLAATTSAAGQATGSKVARNSVGVPASPWEIENAQNVLVLSKCTITSRADHPSHRLGVAHWSSVNPASRPASRRR